MKGDFMHNSILARHVRTAIELKGYPTFEEFPVSRGQRPASVDLAVMICGLLILIEFERSTARIAADVAKARKLGAYLLLIVVPHAQLVNRVGAALKRLPSKSTPDEPRIQVMTLGAALNWIASNCPLPTGTKEVSRSDLPAITHQTTN